MGLAHLRISIFLLAILSVALVVGCQSSNSTSSQKTSSSGQAELADPCAMQLHDISGAILLYYAVHKKLPDQLQDVRGYTDNDIAIADARPLDFTCPVSHEPYVYAPQGLTVVGKNKFAIVYDASPVHDGKRWCVFLTPPAEGQPISLEVVAIPEAVFQTYQPAAQ